MLAVKDPYYLRIAASGVRIPLATIAWLGLSSSYEGIRPLQPMLVGYLALASFFFVLVALRIGDRPRAIAGAVVDLAIITVLVHALGSTASVMTTVYVFAAVLNTLVVGPRIGFWVSVAACLAYGGLLLAEHAHWLSLAVGTADVSGMHAFVSWALTSFMLLTTTTIVGSLLRTNHLREQELRKVNDRLLAITNRDPLTDLWNRRYLFEHLERELKHENARFTLAVFDLDGFKAVNDLFGHLGGDELLRSVAARLASLARSDDIVSRFGGDEFVVLFRGAVHEDIVARVEEMREAVRKEAAGFRGGCQVTASVGITSAHADDDVTEVIRRADDLAYRAKREGRDRVVSDHGG